MAESSAGISFSSFMDLFKKAHAQGDVDFEPNSQHHTLGRSPNQAASGNHRHDELYQRLGDAAQGNVPVGAVFMWPHISGHPSNYLEMNGATINYSNYPALFDAWGVTDPTLTLPDLKDCLPVGASGSKTPGTTHDLTGTLGTDILVQMVALKFLVRAA